MKLLVTLLKPEDLETVRASGSELLAQYPNSVLVRADQAKQAALTQAGLEVAALDEPVVRMQGATFVMASALAADAAEPVSVNPHRTAYYLVQAVGPMTGAWINDVRAAGGTVHATLPAHTLLVGALPAGVETLRGWPWVESISAYRPAMKVSPKLRPQTPALLGIPELTALELDSGSDERQLIEVSIFPGESAAGVAAEVRATGGDVLSQSERSVVATVPPRTIVALANREGVQAILPHALPELFNAQATAVMGVPADHVFGGLSLSGAGQIVAVADSGLDTGDPASIHTDFSGRIAGLVSWPTSTFYAPYTTDPAGSDDGSADTNSAHGTHVAGSVLASGAAAKALGSPEIPQGVAPEAMLYFQAIEQQVNWKTRAQLVAEGRSPFQPVWPPPSVSLYGLPDRNLALLFDAAYTAGARIHTNSWGAPVAGVYSGTARQVDQYMWTHRDMLILFAAGNEGKDADGSGVIDADSISSPGTAKNCLTVGASENSRPSGSIPRPGIDRDWSALGSGASPLWPNLGAAGHVSDNVDGMAAFSSRGPTDDGRIKPDVVAPGTNVLSTRSSAYAAATPPLWGEVAGSLSGRYCWSGGTSMSTPLVAGAAALVRQHLVEQRGHVQIGVKPSGALIKAFLVNGATPIAGQFADEVPAGPNPASGFGRVNVARSLTPGSLQQTLFADEPDYAVETGQIRMFQIQAVDLAQPMKVTLVWTDAPSLEGKGSLQNQLYLQVVEPGGVVRDGDVKPFPNATNNVQQVTISVPVAGQYQIRVRGVSVTQQAPGAGGGPNPRQDFALAASNVIGLSVQPVSVALALDTTGSMQFFGYIEPAKERAAQFVNFLRVNDKVSVSEFSQRGTVPPARTPYPLRLLGAFNPDWSDAQTAIAGLTADGLTPIGAGLQEAWAQLHPEPPGRPRAIVLESDGFNNQPPDPLSVVGSIPVDVPIFAIALGPASNAPTLQAIAASRPNGGYYSVGSDEDIFKLHTIYALVQALATGAATVGLSSAVVEPGAEQAVELPVEPETAEVCFSLSWDGPEHELELVAVGPEGARYDAQSAATTELCAAAHRQVRVAVPRPGPWSLRVLSKSQKPVRYVVSGAVDASLALSAAATTRDGKVLLVEARLRRGQHPWDDAKVVARVELPSRSQQEVLAKFGDEIAGLELPKQLDEPGLSDDERLSLRLALFASRFPSDNGGLYGRTAVEVELMPSGHGRWQGELPFQAEGCASVEVVARGDIKGFPWQRFAGISTTLGARSKPARQAAH